MDPQSRQPNALLNSTSPYLLQHAYNPVHWHPWSPESLAKAKTENKPIFLSIGYSACHWCHVMEHQVFENEKIADLMNAHFINIKVDREERPDLDDLYMLATQLMTGQGGWPMSVFLTPDLKPFYAGTYFPPTDSYGRPGFPKVLTALADAWQNNRPALLAQSEKVVAAIHQHADETAAPTSAPEDIDAGPWIAQAIQHHTDTFDPVNGGLGSAPKFPPHQTLNLWLHLLQFLPTQNTSHETLSQIQTMLTTTLDRMAAGGIYDHLAGGFARYSTDEKWLVPHFEKMLYDNAQLAPLYAQASVLLNNPNYAAVARGTLDFWLRDMTGPDGQFFSTLDADSEGEEGKFYVWTLAEIRAAFPNPTDQQLLIDHFNLTEKGNWPESPIKNGHVLALAQLANPNSETPNPRLPALLLEMRNIRSSRAWPSLDDKVLTSWNALFISALAISSWSLNEPRYLAAAQKALAYLQTHHMKNHQLLRVSRKDTLAHTPGFLDDHAYLLQALLDLHEASPSTELLTQAQSLADTLLQNFEDPTRGGFFFTTPSHEQLFTRMKNAADNATPSPTGIAIHALLQLSALTSNEKYATAAHRAIAAFAPHIARRPDFFPTLLTALISTQSPATTTTTTTTNTTNNTTPLHDSPIISLTAPPNLHLPQNSPLQIPLTVQIAPTYHIQTAENPQPNTHPTRLTLRTDLPLSASISYPPPTMLEANIPAYENTLQIIIECSLQKPTPPGRYTLRATLSAQPCTSTHCLQPQTISIDIPLTIS